MSAICIQFNFHCVNIYIYIFSVSIIVGKCNHTHTSTSCSSIWTHAHFVWFWCVVVYECTQLLQTACEKPQVALWAIDQVNTLHYIDDESSLFAEDVRTENVQRTLFIDFFYLSMVFFFSSFSFHILQMAKPLPSSFTSSSSFSSPFVRAAHANDANRKAFDKLLLKCLCRYVFTYMCVAAKTKDLTCFLTQLPF